MNYGFAVLTISDRCSTGQNEDTSGPLLKQLIQECSPNGSIPFMVVDYEIVPDDKVSIQNTLRKWSNQVNIKCVLTTGGTGLSSRDVTPEATAEIIDKEVPGISLALISASLKITPMAMLSRMKCGILNGTLIINLPGSQKACHECFDVIKPVLKHAIDQLNDSKKQVDDFHQKLQEDATKSRVKQIVVTERHRHSPYEMISISDAFRKIVNEIGDHFKCISNELVEKVSAKNLHKALNLVLANDVYASVPLPPFDASMKDGYAVIAQDGEGLRKVINKALVAGSNSNLEIESGFCARITTGAALPKGSDSVVQVEDTELIETTEDKSEEKVIRIKTIPAVGQDIRRIGCDIPLDNNPLIKKFTELTSIDLGLIASTGVENIQVFRQPKIAVLSTGDEIISAGESRPWNCVWDSNRTILLSLLMGQQLEVIDLGIAPDRPDSIFSHFKHGFKMADVIISTGGVSMGERDLMKQILKEDFSAKIHFGRVNLKPGKPTTFATTMFEDKKKFIFCLPGNPVSAYVTFKLFVDPALRLLSGKYFEKLTQEITHYSFHKWIKCKVLLDEPFKMDSRPEFVRAKVSFSSTNQVPIARLTESTQISSRLLNVKDANALIFIQSKNGEQFLNDGDFADAILL